MELEKKESELEIARKEAFSLKESTAGMVQIGATENKEGKINFFFKDKEGSYWYSTKYRVGEKLITEEEHIFGRNIQPVRSYKRKW